MKRIILFVSIVLFSLSIFAQVNGNLQKVNDKSILHVWGSHYERGYAQGYLLANETLDVFNSNIWQLLAMSNLTYYNTLLTYWTSHFTVEEKYQSEASGMLAGIQAAGVSIYHSGMHRDLTVDDILLANSIIDLAYMGSLYNDNNELDLGCASISSWGVSTAADTLLAGHLTITRFLDWNTDESLISNPILIIHYPSEPNEQKWMSFTYPGLFGTLSSISESGKAAFLNMGNVHNYQNISNLHPVMFALRSAMEVTDYNSDGSDDLLDVYQSILDRNQLSGTIIHSVHDNSISINAAAIETNNSAGTTIRYSNQNGNLPDGHLAATNHFRLLYNPVCCTRYSNIQDSLNTNPLMTAKRQWTMLGGAAGLDNNMMAIQYVPVSGTIKWATATLSTPAYTRPADTYTTAELFSFSNPISDDVVPVVNPSISIYPNPWHNSDVLSIKASSPIKSIAIYNVKGQLIERVNITQNSSSTQTIIKNKFSNGIYFIRVNTDKPHVIKLAVIN